MTPHEVAIAAASVGALVTLMLSNRLFDLVSESLSWCLSWVLVTKMIVDDEACDAVMRHLAGESFNAGIERYVMRYEHVRPLRERRMIWGLIPSAQWRVFRYRGAPVLWNPAGDGPGKNLVYLRGTVDFGAMIRDVEERVASERRDRKVRRFSVVRHGTSGFGKVAREVSNRPSHPDEAPPQPARVDSGSDGAFRPVTWSPDDIGPDVEGAQLDDLSLTDDMRDVVRELEFWQANRDWYRDRGIAWQRGYVFHGKPGTGKTSLVRALAERLDMPVHVFDLIGMHNSDLIRGWSEASMDAPRFILLEDVDTVFNGRENIRDDTALSFDCVLNVIDGIERNDGLILVITTNHIEKLDPALLRAGRGGRQVEFGPMDQDGRAKVARRIVRDPKVEARLVREGAADTPAAFQARCMTEAERTLWAGRRP